MRSRRARSLLFDLLWYGALHDRRAERSEAEMIVELRAELDAYPEKLKALETLNALSPLDTEEKLVAAARKVLE